MLGEETCGEEKYIWLFDCVQKINLFIKTNLIVIRIRVGITVKIPILNMFYFSIFFIILNCNYYAFIFCSWENASDGVIR